MHAPLRRPLACLLRAAADFLVDERGSAVVEYAALSALGAVAGLAAERAIGERVARMLFRVADALPG